MKINIISLFIFLSICIYANAQNKFNYILNGNSLLDIRTINQINLIAKEVKQKTGVNIYLDVKGDNGIDINLPFKDRVAQNEKIKEELIKNLVKPYAILVIAMDQQYVGILMSKDLENVIDGDDVRDSYVVPLLAAKDKNTLKSKISAASFNGYAQIADSIAEQNGIKLETSIGSQGKTASTIWRVFVYTLVVSGIILYTIIILREKKLKRKEISDNGNE